MPPSAAADVQALDALITSTLALLSQFTTSLAATSAASTSAAIKGPPNPLDILSDASRLLKAHVTKISLLAINKPFTPSAITTIIREVAGTCLPAMMSAVQICEQEETIWPEFVGKEAQLRVRRVFREMESLLKEVRNISQGTGAGLGGKRDSLSCTGVVWEACDALAELRKLGIAGLAVQKAEQWRDTIKDAIEELKEWMEGEALDSEGQKDALLDSDDEGVDGDADSFDDIFNAANSMPADRPELKVLVEKAVEKLRRVGLLYNALIKRRLKVYRSAGEVKGNAKRVDEIMVDLRAIPHMIDELASTFYDLDEERARIVLDKCVARAKGVATLAAKSYDGNDDEFTEARADANQLDVCMARESMAPDKGGKKGLRETYGGPLFLKRTNGMCNDGLLLDAIRRGKRKQGKDRV
ncbi:hypothetical protein B0A48_04088 [Cryoendolithus antarcticus]|uniref:Cyclin-D1-binding protein 1-like N-terminal domain-containing protein n=1 Tax=Cryoendolithus antarcticus TaxID=1507870 RepID=A0A1V8THP9_9PEZI|nr:hypothetical protein B0A48_04088 [Cryoendolithus antarcticus]